MKIMKKETGSITLFVLIAMIFFLLIVVNACMRMGNSMNDQNDEMQQIKSNYEQDLTEERLDEIYKEKSNQKSD